MHFVLLKGYWIERFTPGSKHESPGWQNFRIIASYVVCSTSQKCPAMHASQRAAPLAEYSPFLQAAGVLEPKGQALPAGQVLHVSALVVPSARLRSHRHGFLC